MTGCIPKNEADLSALKMVQTGGSHLEKDQYYWFYRTFPTKIHLTSVTGGTDLVTSWIGTDPAGPVYPGEIQLPMLGQDVDIADPITGEIVKDSGKQGGSSAGNRSPRCRCFSGVMSTGRSIRRHTAVNFLVSGHSMIGRVITR